MKPPYSRSPGTPSATNQVFPCPDNPRGKGLVRCNRSAQRQEENCPLRVGPPRPGHFGLRAHVDRTAARNSRACVMPANEAAILRIRRASHTANPGPVSLRSLTEARKRASKSVTVRNTAPHGHIPDQDGPTHHG